MNALTMIVFLFTLLVSLLSFSVASPCDTFSLQPGVSSVERVIYDNEKMNIVVEFVVGKIHYRRVSTWDSRSGVWLQRKWVDKSYMGGKWEELK